MSGILIRNLKPENIKQGVEILNVKGTFEGGGSATVNNQDITVDSSIVEQTFTAGEGYTGLGTVTVNPYTLETKSVDSSTVSQTITTDKGLSSVTVNPYVLETKSVDSSTVSQTVTSQTGMSSVTVNPYTLGTKTVDPSTSQQTVVTSTYDGMSSVTVNAVTSSIDPNIQASNIKQGETILGVTGTFDGQGTDWILDAKNTADAVINSDTEGLSSVNYGMMNLFENSNVKTAVFTNTTATAQSSFDRILRADTNLQTVSFPNLTSVTGPYCFNLSFENCSGMQRISFPALTTINANYAFYQALRGTSSNLVMEFPELQTITGDQAFTQLRYGINGFYPQFPKLRDVSGNNAFSNFHENAGGSSSPVPYELPELRTVNGPYAMCNFCLGGRGGVSSLSLPKLEEINRYGNAAFQGLSTNNSRMRSLSMPKLQYCNGSNTPFRWMWQSVSSSPGNTITTTPEFFKYSGSSMYEIQAYLGTINIVTDGYTYLGGWNPSTVHLNFNGTVVNNNDLTDANILHILTKLGEVTDYDQVHYTVNFTLRTITDNANLDYTNAIAKLTTAGWTVTGLTIDAPQNITLNSSSRINLYSGEDTIDFDALGSWTASVDDNDVSLSSYSGSAGTGIQLTVTAAQGFTGPAVVTLTCEGTSVTVTVVNSQIQLITSITTNGDRITTVPMRKQNTVAKCDVQAISQDANFSSYFICPSDANDRTAFRLAEYNYPYGGGTHNIYGSVNLSYYSSQQLVSITPYTRHSSLVFGCFKDNVNNLVLDADGGSATSNWQWGSSYTALSTAALQIAGSLYGSGSSVKIWSIKIYEDWDNTIVGGNNTGGNDKVLVHDYVPAYNGSEYGLYDKIDDVFYPGDTGGLITGEW